MRTLVAYVPVLHEGYRRFFEKYDGPKELYIFGPEIASEFPWLSKEIRQLDPELMRIAIESLGIFEKVSVLSVTGALHLNESENALILPDEDISRQLAEKYFTKASVMFDSIFLRWDKHNSIEEKPVRSDESISRDEFHRTIMKDLSEESKKSSDNWRHVAAAIAKDGKIISTRHNEHLPSEHSPYVHGDPRNNFHKGDHIEISSAIHAEARLIAEAAREGVVLAGADMFVTVFPCPPCSKLIAFSGIKNLYCEGGYAVLDGEDILKMNGVNITWVQ